jgi:hypothetical protein
MASSSETLPPGTKVRIKPDIARNLRLPWSRLATQGRIGVVKPNGIGFSSDMRWGEFATRRGSRKPLGFDFRTVDLIEVVDESVPP